MKHALRHITRHLAAALTALLPVAAAAGEAFADPVPFSATYEVRLNNLPFTADARQSLTALGGNRWRLELKVESFILDTTETSEFRWDGSRCHAIPGHYRYSRKGIGRNRTLDMQFDTTRNIVAVNDGRKQLSYAITALTEDKLAHTLGLACRIARGARGQVAVDVAWDRELRHFDYRVGTREETVVTPSGNWQALRFERQRTDSERLTTSWIAAKAGWQAIQMQHTEGDGKLFQLRLLQLQQDAGGKPAPGGNRAP